MEPRNPVSIHWGIALVRIIVGVVFLAHGGMKLFGLGLEGTTGFVASLGFPLPAVAAILLIATETLGGLALVLGLGTRFVAAPLAFAMLVAVTRVHLANGFFLPNGYEFALLMLVLSVALGLTGSGALALDTVIARRARPTDEPASWPLRRAA
jgi:putative oxidoreductase